LATANGKNAMIKPSFSVTTAMIAAGAALLGVIWFKRAKRPPPVKEAPKSMTREGGSRGTAPLFKAAVGYAFQRISTELLSGLHRRTSSTIRDGGSRRRDWVDGIATAALVNFLDGRAAPGGFRRDPATSLSGGARTALYAAFSVGLAVARQVRRRMRASPPGSARGGGQLAYSGDREARGISRY